MPEGNIAAEQHRKRERKVVHGEHRTPDYVERQGKPGERAITKRPHQQAIKSSKDFQGSEGREKLDELRVGEAVAVETDEGLLVVSEVLDRKFDQLDISEHEAKKLLKMWREGRMDDPDYDSDDPDWEEEFGDWLDDLASETEEENSGGVSESLTQQKGKIKRVGSGGFED